MRHQCNDQEDYINFVTRLFDPNETGFVKGSEFESLINSLFETEINDEDQGDPNKKVASFSELLLEHCAKIGVYKVDGFFNLEAMKRAFREGTLEIDTFLQALK